MSRRSVKTRLFLSGIGLLLALAGAVFLWLMWRSFQRARAMREWPEVEAVVLSSEVAERRVGNTGPAEFRFEVLFGYEWQGERLSSDRWSLRGRPGAAKGHSGSARNGGRAAAGPGRRGAGEGGTQAHSEYPQA